MRVRDVSVHIERVRSMPHGAKLFIDEPPGEDLVVWILDGPLDDDVADAINLYLSAGDRTRTGRRVEGIKQFAS